MSSSVLSTKNRKLALSLLMVGIGMVCMAYGFVPLYRIFCQVTGIGGVTQKAEAAPEQVLGRQMTVRFDAITDPRLPWEFEAQQVSMDVQVGKRSLAFFRTKNLADTPVTGMATFNVTPHKAGPYFNKIQCFCFDEQTLLPGEEVDMPVSFFVDPAIAEDENLDEVQTITLSYTFFKSKSSEE